MRFDQAPNSWTIRQLMNSTTSAEVKPGVWEPARPIGYYSLRHRCRLAWAVFTGRADALFWPDQNPRAY